MGRVQPRSTRSADRSPLGKAIPRFTIPAEQASICCDVTDFETGKMHVRSDGVTSTRSGNMLYFSGGTTSQKVGNSWRRSAATTTQTIGTAINPI